MKKLLLLSLLICSQSFALTNDDLDQIKHDCEKKAKIMCGDKCVEPELAGTGDYPDGWTQEMKNKEWNKRAELRKKHKEYEIALETQNPYINYCKIKEEDFKQNQSVNAMIQRKVLEHENIFFNWNKYRLAELNTNSLIFSTIEKDRDIYNKRYDFYKKNTYMKIRNSINSFTEVKQLDKRLSVFDGKHKNVEYQNEFLTYLANDLSNFNALINSKAKLDARRNVLYTSEMVNIEINKKEKEALFKYLTLIERMSNENIEKLLREKHIVVNNHDD